MSWILTNSGKHFDLLDPQPDMIDIMDIAHGLANECRFAGQCVAFYSVAQHSVAASKIVAPEFALEALLHDASEAYLKDIPSPLKALLPDYKKIEERLEGVIRARYGLPEAQSAAVTDADRIMLATERRDLMPKDNTDWPILEGFKPMARKLAAVDNKRARAMFHKRLVELCLA